MKKIVLIFSIMIMVFIVGYGYLFQPHITFEEVRISNKPQEIKAVYVNITGDPLCAKLYRLERMEKGKPVASDEPIFLALPKDLPSPEDGKLAYSDNLFILSGYRRQFEERNKLTGKLKASPSNRFDVIAWEVIPPYKQWRKKDSGSTTPVKAITATTPVRYQTANTDHSPTQFVKGNYVDCLSTFESNGSSKMNKIETMWEHLIASETESEEREIVELVNTYMAGKRIQVNIQAVVNPQGEEIGLDKISENRNVIIKATFKEGDVSYKAPDWIPRNHRNVFILFRE